MSRAPIGCDPKAAAFVFRILANLVRASVACYSRGTLSLGCLVLEAGLKLPLALAATLLTASGLEAQTVLGMAVDGVDERPIAGAFVLLLDDNGAERDRDLTTRQGTFRLTAPAAGDYTVRLQRIGFNDTESASFAIPATGTVSRRVVAEARPVELAELHVTGGEPRCGTPVGDVAGLSRAWREARKALEVNTWTEQYAAYRFDHVVVRQVRDEDGRPIGAPEFQRGHVLGRHGFRAAEPDQLASAGWVQEQADGGLKYYGPDAEVLLSRSFLNSHCFRLVQMEADTEDALLGIDFKPLPHREFPDISGVIWLDRASAELRSVDYRYEQLPLPVHSDRIGGTIEFDHLPAGTWIVSSWEIRTPLVERVLPRPGDLVHRPYRLVGIHHETWRVLAVQRLHSNGKKQLIRRYPAPQGLELMIEE